MNDATGSPSPPGRADRQQSVTVALDAMGADFEPACAVEAAALALRHDGALSISLYGNADGLDAALSSLPPALAGRIERISCSRYVPMTASPAEALRRHRQSSMALGLESLTTGKAHALVSSGNTGALMVLARAALGMLPGVERPALMTAFPVVGGRAWVLDLGANIGVDADRLTEFALLGAAAVSALIGRRARVGLLNIGVEKNKGPDVIREAARRCEQADIDLVGFIEGHEVFAGRADVIVCDGFAGNVLLKSAEGVIDMLLDEIDGAAGKIWAGPGLRRLRKNLRHRYDPIRHNGASMLGINGIVIKSHAHACARGLAHAIDVAALEVRRGLLPELERQLWMGA